MLHKDIGRAVGTKSEDIVSSTASSLSMVQASKVLDDSCNCIMALGPFNSILSINAHIITHEELKKVVHFLIATWNSFGAALSKVNLKSITFE